MRLLLFFALLMLAGCGVSYPRPRFPHTDAQALLRAHESLRERVRSIRAEASIDQRGEGGRIRGQVMTFIERPNHVRFDVMTQFGPVAILTSDGRAFALLDLRERRFLRGGTCPENLSRLVGVTLSDDDVGRVLLGATPVLADAEASLELLSNGVYRVRLLAAGGQRQEIDYFIRDADVDAPPSEQRLRLLRSERYAADGSTLWRVDYDDYRVMPLGPMGVAFPYVIQFADPVRERDVRVRFVSVDLNVEIPEGAFQQQPPPGVAQEEAPCLQAEAR